MRNPKTLKKVMGVALVLAMLVGAFSVFTVGTAAESADAYNWLDGVDFSDYTGATQEEAHENFAVYVDTHTHTLDDAKVEVGYDTLSSLATCICGESLSDGDVSEVITTADEVYVGNGTIEGLPTEGTFWIATDYNVRTAAALETAGNVMKLGDCVIAIDTAKLAAPATNQVAVKVAYTAANTADIDVYLDGVLYEAKKDVALENATALYLGEEGASDAIRFFRTKIVKLAIGGTKKVTYNLVNLDGIKPCAHEFADDKVEFVTVPVVYDETYTKVKAVNKLMRVYTCETCGEVVYFELDNLLKVKDTGDIELDETGSANNITDVKQLYIDRLDVSSAGKPYWISFDINVENLKEFTGTVSIFNVQVPYAPEDWTSGDNNAYIHLLRGFAVEEENAIGVNFFNGSSRGKEFILREGEPRHIDIFMDVDDDVIYYEGYVDGVLTYTNSVKDGKKLRAYNGNRTDDKVNALTSAFRFNSHASGAYTFSNFAYVVDEEPEDHVHTPEWSAPDQKILKFSDTTLEYSYICYCGDTVPVGVINGNVYGDEGIQNVYENGKLALAIPEGAGEFWVSADYNVRSADAKNPTAVIGIGDGENVIAKFFEVNANGELLGAEKLLDVKKPASYNLTVRVLNATSYELYVDGAYIGVYTNEAVADGKLMLNTGNARFNNIKVVTLGETETPVVPVILVDKTVKPCAHKIENADVITGVRYNAAGSLVYNAQCSECGETIYDVPLVDRYNGGGITDANGNISFTGAKYYNLPAELIGADKGVYQFEFTLTLDALDSGDLYNNGGGRNLANYHDGNSYSSFLRQHPVSDGKGGYLNDRTDIKIQNTAKTHLVTLIKGEKESAEFTIIATPATNTVKIYVDGEYKGSHTNAIMSSVSQIRFGDGPTSDFTLSNVKLFQNGELVHEHSEEWVTPEEKWISVTDKTLEYRYKCYCGETVLGAQIVSNIYENGIKNVYEDSIDELNAPTAPYWLAVDYNARTADAPKADIDINGTKFDLGTLVELNGPATATVVFNVIDNDTYQLYVDGKFIGEYDVEGAEFLGGKIELSTGNNARFNKVKLVTLGETDSPAIPKYIIDETVRPCAHVKIASIKFVTLPGATYNGTEVKAINKLMRVETCATCGENSYIEQGDVLGINENGTLYLDETGSTTAITGSNTLGIDRLDVSSAGKPFWISFDIGVENLKDITGNVSIFNVQVPYAPEDWTSGDNNAYIHLLRGYAVSEENAIGIKFRQSDSEAIAFVLKEGEPRHIAIFMDVDDDVIYYEGYVDGVLTYTNSVKYEKALRAYNGNRTDDKVNALTSAFRFNSHASGAYTFSNFALVESREAAEHTHSNDWLNAEELAATTVTVLDGKLAYEYDCYCGERVTAGIHEIIADKINPAYSLTEAVTISETAKLPNNTMFAGQLAIKELPDEGTKALVTVGGAAMLAVDAEGVVYVNGSACGATVTADAEKYIDFAVYFKDGYVHAYFDGAYVGHVSNLETNEIVIGSEGMGQTHFDRMVIAGIDSYQNNSYEYTDSNHVHVFDPTVVELVFNEDRTTITVDYICLVCDRPATDGITKNLYDDETTTEVVEMIPTIVDTTDNGTVVLDETVLAGKDSYWFSADFGVVTYTARNIRPVVSVGDKALVLLDTDGTIRLDHGNYTVVGAIGSSGVANVTFNVKTTEEGAIAIVYVDGKYCFTYELDGATDVITVGGADAHNLSVGNIKLVEMANDGQLAIGAVSSTYHTFDAKKTKVEYLDNKTFVVTNKCLVCGLTVTEKPAYNYYEGTMLPIYDSWGNIELGANKEAVSETVNELYHGYWIVADVNVRGEGIGAFEGFKNLIGEKGLSYVLINKDMRIMLGDGTFPGQYLSPVSTANIAIEVVDIDEKYINVYIDGAYVGSVNLADIKEKYEYGKDTENKEEFGAAELENIKFYNIKSFIPCSKGEFVTFDYAEDETVVPCPHIVGDAENATLATVGDNMLKFYYLCSKCGERVNGEYDVDIYASSGNTAFKDGKRTITNTTALKFANGELGSKGANFWLTFKLGVEAVNVDGVAGKGASGANFLNFNTNYNSPLRLFIIEGATDRLLIRSNNTASSTPVGEIVVGGSYDIALYVMPSTKKVDIYFNGEFITTRTNATYATGTELRFLDGNWGTFNISEFKMLSCDAFAHEHTDKYSVAMNAAPTVYYGDTTLTYTYMCTCGETVTEGISKIYANEILDVENVFDTTAIYEAASARMDGTPYWVSAKVYSNANNTAVYTYGEAELVGVSGGYFTVNGVATEKAAAVVGDYNVVSIRVSPLKDTVDVYIDGAYIDSIACDIADSEKFNIKLGGVVKSETQAVADEPVGVDFKFIKIVSLAKDAKGEVVLPICNHEFAYRFGVTAKATPEGIEYNCKYCDEKVLLRTVTIGNGTKVEVAKYDAFVKDADGMVKKENGKVVLGDFWIADFTEYKDKIFGKSLGGTFFITFDVNASDLSGVKDEARKSFITWTPATSITVEENGEVVGKSTGFEHLISLKLIDSQYVVVLGNDEVNTAGVMELNKTHNFIFEIDSANGKYYAYMDNQYLGSAKINIELSGKDYYPLRVNNTTGAAVFTNFKMFKPETVKDEDAPNPNPTTPVHYHFPSVTKGNTITVKNGKITHTFVCSCCTEGKTVTLNAMNNIVTEKLKFSGITRSNIIEAGSEFSYGAAPYVVSFDFSANVINMATIIKKSSGTGSSFLAILRPEDKDAGLATEYTHLLRAFAHTYKGDEGKGYVDEDNDGYADNVIDLRKSSSKTSTLLATIGVDEVVNFTYVIDPTACKVLVYVNGEYKTSINANLFKEDVQIRIFDGGYGSYNLDNFKLVRMSDECVHTGPSCANAKYVGDCVKCGKVKVEVKHNYKVEYDRTGMWIKYTCADCGVNYVAFRDVTQVQFSNREEFFKHFASVTKYTYKSKKLKISNSTQYTSVDYGVTYIVRKDKTVVADLTFANKDELYAYLTENYFPVFR